MRRCIECGTAAICDQSPIQRDLGCRVYLEEGFSEETIEDLKRRGYEVLFDQHFHCSCSGIAVTYNRLEWMELEGAVVSSLRCDLDIILHGELGAGMCSGV